MSEMRFAGFIPRILHPQIFSKHIKQYRDTWVIQNNNGNLRINLLLWLILFVANLIDLLVTYYAFSKGAVEANPAMSALCVKFGEVSLAFYKGLLLGILLFLLPYIKRYLLGLLAFSCSVYAVLVLSHIIRF